MLQAKKGKNGLNMAVALQYTFYSVGKLSRNPNREENSKI
jgi:hypothetical protein